jgi:glutamyl-tRNA reductase
MITHCHYNIREITDIDDFKHKLQLHTRYNAVVVQTCKRLEVYSGEGEFSAPVALHLFRLVCGLDSVFIGDTAIKSQVKNAYLESAKKGYLSKNMHKLFQWALYVGKLVRSTTDIALGAVSYPQAVINILKTLDPDLCNLTITLVGINDITAKLLKWLNQSGVLRLNMVNRTLTKAENMARNYGASAFQLNQLIPVMARSDVLILCASASDYLIRKSDITSRRKLCIFDLSWPRNADPDIAELIGIQIFTLDQIEQNINQNLEKRKESLQLAELIIDQELYRIMAWQKTTEIIPAVHCTL